MHNIENPTVPATFPINEPLQDGAEISVHGHVSHDHHKDFVVELLSGQHVVLHVNFRFDHEHTVVLNSSSFGEWGQELRHHNPLKHHDQFALHIRVQQGHYHVSVNGIHLGDFAHRIPYQSVQALGIKGHVHVDKITFHGFHFQRDWNEPHDYGHGGYNNYGNAGYVAPQFQGDHAYNAYFQ